MASALLAPAWITPQLQRSLSRSELPGQIDEDDAVQLGLSRISGL
jgi:hypothetical protein